LASLEKLALGAEPLNTDEAGASILAQDFDCHFTATTALPIATFPVES
jgi:hypothetical protein